MAARRAAESRWPRKLTDPANPRPTETGTVPRRNVTDASLPPSVIPSTSAPASRAARGVTKLMCDRPDDERSQQPAGVRHRGRGGQMLPGVYAQQPLAAEEHGQEGPGAQAWHP